MVLYGRTKREAVRDVTMIVGIGLGYLVGIVVGLWLLWLGITAFLFYGYQAIVWVLG